MEGRDPASANSTWRDALQPGLVRRLARPLVRPGVVGGQPAQAILARAERMAGGLPLLADLNQRHGTVGHLQARQAPVVYARPGRTAVPAQNVARDRSPARPPTRQGGTVVQRAVDASAESARWLPDAVRQTGGVEGTAAAPSTHQAGSPPPSPGREPETAGRRAVSTEPMAAPVVQRAAVSDSTAALVRSMPTIYARRRADDGGGPSDLPGSADAQTAPKAAVPTESGRQARPHRPVVQPVQRAPGPPSSLKLGVTGLIQPSTDDNWPVVQPVERVRGVSGQRTLGQRSSSRVGATGGKTEVRGAAVSTTSASTVIQRSTVRPVVAETQPPAWAGSRVPLALPGPASGTAQPHGGFKPGQPAVAPAAGVIQRLPLNSNPPVSSTGAETTSTVVSGTSGGREMDLDVLVERVQVELDLEDLVEKVGRELRRRFVVESERRGWLQWP